MLLGLSASGSELFKFYIKTGTSKDNGQGETAEHGYQVVSDNDSVIDGFTDQTGITTPMSSMNDPRNIFVDDYK